VDHHLLRTTEYSQFLSPVKKSAEKSNHEVLTASELIGKNPNLLEARRKELHEKEPVEEDWYEDLEEGKFEEKF